MYPIPGNSIDTPYHRRGTLWKACGWHTGVDFEAPKGTPIYAPIAGTIRHRDYGIKSFGPFQFAISPSPGQPFADGEVFFAHVLDRLPDGTEVQAGQLISHVGDLGNATGFHLHFEFHPNAKNSWGCNVVADPEPVLSWKPATGGGGGGGGPTYPPPTSKTVYVSKLKYGTKDSDSVWHLQNTLNSHKLSGGATLPLTAGYFDMTDAEVIKCQVQHGFGHDPAGASFVGPNQAQHLFAGAGLTVVYDTGNPSDPGPIRPPAGQDKPEAPALMLPGAIWDPITNFPGLRPYTGTAKKITLHTTETLAKPNWEQQQSGIPHLTVNLATGTRWQHLDFHIAAYTMTGGVKSPNSDSGMNIQIEIIGLTKYCSTWPQHDYDELADILHWLCDNLGMPYEFPTPFSTQFKLNWDQWSQRNGILGHLHAPYNTHTDPNGLRTDLLMPTPPQPEPEPPIQDYVTRDEFEAYKTGIEAWMAKVIEVTSDYLNGS